MNLCKYLFNNTDTDVTINTIGFHSIVLKNHDYFARYLHFNDKLTLSIKLPIDVSIECTKVLKCYIYEQNAKITDVNVCIEVFELSRCLHINMYNKYQSEVQILFNTLQQSDKLRILLNTHGLFVDYNIDEIKEITSYGSLNLMGVYYNDKDSDKAFELFKQSWEENENQDSLYYLANKSDKKMALELYNKLWEYKNPAGKFGLANYHYNNGNVKKAINIHLSLIKNYNYMHSMVALGKIYEDIDANKSYKLYNKVWNTFKYKDVIIGIYNLLQKIRINGLNFAENIPQLLRKYSIIGDEEGIPCMTYHLAEIYKNEDNNIAISLHKKNWNINRYTKSADILLENVDTEEKFKITKEYYDHTKNIEKGIFLNSYYLRNNRHIEAFNIAKDMCANSNSSLAFYTLIHHYENGIGTNINLNIIPLLYKERWRKTKESYIFLLWAKCYLEGKGVKRDPIRAFYMNKYNWEQNAVIESGKLLVNTYLTIKKDPTKAFEIADKIYLAIPSNSNLVLLSRCYLEGYGTNEEREERVLLLENLHNEVQSYNAVVVLVNWYNNKKDYVKEFEYLRSTFSSMGLESDLLHRLGKCYALGIGTDVNPKKAFECFEHDYKLNKGSMYMLAACYQAGFGVDQDLTRAYQLHKQNKDNINIRLFNLHGWGTTKKSWCDIDN